MKGVFLYFIMIVCILLITPLSCSNQSNSNAWLNKSGYTDIEMKGYGWFGCSGNDVFKSKFSAVDKSGRGIDGVVCKGLLSGYYVRED